MKTFLSFLLLILMGITVAAQDTFRFSANYKDSRVPVIGYDDEDVIRGFGAAANVKLFKVGPVRASAEYVFEQRYDAEVYPDYEVPCLPAATACEPMIVDLYRNVRTHFGGGQLGLSLGGAVEPFVGYYIGTEKIHVDALRQLVQKVRVGVNVPFHKKSKFFITGSVDFNKPFGSPEGGFVNPDSRFINIGAGFRF